MDPVQTFNDLTTAFIAQEWVDAKQHAFDLLDWLAKGGFFPLDRQSTVGYCVTIERICRSHIERS